MILEKIEPSILNDLGYIVRLEKKNGNKKYTKPQVLNLRFLYYKLCNESKYN